MGRMRVLQIAAMMVLLAACGHTNHVAETQSVSLYYYDPALDQDAGGNIQCSEAGLVAVHRSIPASLAGEGRIQVAIELLLNTKPTVNETAQGLTSEFPLEGLMLTDVTLDGGVVTLTFDDPKFRTSGGACRSGILWAQIEQTALQFSGVETVRFEPESLFQP